MKNRKCYIIQFHTQSACHQASFLQAEQLFQILYLVEASVEDPLHLLRIERDPLDLTTLVLVVERHGFPGSWENEEETLCSVYFSRSEVTV